MDNATDIIEQPKERYSKEFKYKGINLIKTFPIFLINFFLAGLFLTAVSGASIVFGFSAALISAKKQDPKYFGKGFIPTRGIPETGASLALRALGWGSLYAVTGCGVLFYGIWKLSGASNVSRMMSL